MRILCLLVIGLLLLMVVGCTTTPREEHPKIHCPACGTELDSVYQKRF
ncbi:MAG: hypothetical protein ACYC9I_09460 [Desulfuromonadales bacterium]